MVPIFQKTYSNAFSWMKKMYILIKISLKFVPKGPINNIPAQVQIMAWRRPGDKPLSESMMAWFTDTDMCHSASELNQQNDNMTLHITVPSVRRNHSTHGFSRQRTLMWNYGIHPFRAAMEHGIDFIRHRLYICKLMVISFQTCCKISHKCALQMTFQGGQWSWNIIKFIKMITKW